MDAKTTLRVTPSDSTFDYWLDKSFVPDSLRTQLAKANVLIVPQLGYLDYKGPLFPTGTEEFYHFLKEQDSEEFVVDICIDDDQFKSLARLHDEFYLPTMIIVPAVAHIFAHYVIRFIDDRLRSGASKTVIKSEVIIQDPETDKSVKVSYEGPASEYDEFVGSTLRLVESEQDLKSLLEIEDMDHKERIRLLSERKEN